MYISTYCASSSKSSSSILRACRVRSTSSLSSPVNHSFSPSSRTFKPASHASTPPSNVSYRSPSFSPAFRSVSCSALRWSHRVDLRSPVSLRAQIRSSSPVLERFERKIATMGMIRFVRTDFELNYVMLDYWYLFSVSYVHFGF